MSHITHTNESLACHTHERVMSRVRMCLTRITEPCDTHAHAHAHTHTHTRTHTHTHLHTHTHTAGTKLELAPTATKTHPSLPQQLHAHTVHDLWPSATVGLLLHFGRILPLLLSFRQSILLLVRDNESFYFSLLSLCVRH